MELNRTEVPPPRYRVVERGRRLEVIDLWTGQATGTVAPLGQTKPTARPAAGGDDPAQPGNAGSARRATLPGPRSFTGPPAQHLPTTEGDSSPVGWVVGALTGGAKDTAGRPLLTTAAWYDLRAPRQLPLNPHRINQLGGAALGLLLVTLVGLALFGPVTLALPIAIGAIVLQQERTITTRWLDRVASDIGP